VLLVGELVFLPQGTSCWIVLSVQLRIFCGVLSSKFSARLSEEILDCLRVFCHSSCAEKNRAP
jgi:hypothetical protein